MNRSTEILRMFEEVKGDFLLVHSQKYWSSLMNYVATFKKASSGDAGYWYTFVAEVQDVISKNRSNTAVADEISRRYRMRSWMPSTPRQRSPFDDLKQLIRYLFEQSPVGKDMSSGDLGGRSRPQSGQGAGILLKSGREVMLFFRNPSPKVHMGALWSCPGGLVNPGEDAWDAASRETWEETHLDYRRSRAPQKHLINKEGRNTYHTFIIEVDPAEKDHLQPRLDREHTKYGWYDIDAALETLPLHPGMAKTLRQL